MFPENMVLSVTDVLNFHQKPGHFKVAKRSFSAISLRESSPGKYIFKDKAIDFSPVSVCLIPEGIDYERFADEDDILVIHFHTINFVMENIEVFKVYDVQKYRGLFEKALRIRETNTAGALYRETAVLYEIFAELISDFGTLNTEIDNNIAETAEYMRQNFSDSRLTVALLAEKANISLAGYRRKFNQIYGVSPKKYLNSLRFGYAKTLLETGYFSQKEIAYRCGFSDVNYFRTAFKKENGKCIKNYFAANK